MDSKSSDHKSLVLKICIVDQEYIFYYWVFDILIYGQNWDYT